MLDKNSSSFLLRQYLLQTVPKLVPPLEEEKGLACEPGDGEVDGLDTIYNDLAYLFICVASVDNEICVDEIILMRVVINLFKVDDLSRFSTDRQVRDIYRRDICRNPNLYKLVRVPIAVQYLKIYDYRYGTDYAEKAKAMYLHFADAIAKADDEVTKQEENFLSKFRDLLSKA